MSPICHDFNSRNKTDIFSGEYSCKKLKFPIETMTDEIKTVVAHKGDFEFWQEIDWHSLELPDYQNFDAVVRMKISSNDTFHASVKFLIGTLMVEIKAACSEAYGEWKTNGNIWDSFSRSFELSRDCFRTNDMIPKKTRANFSIPFKVRDWQRLVSMTTNKILLLKLPSQVWRPPERFWWKKSQLYLWRKMGLNNEVFEKDWNFLVR